jgi:ABC-type bacteriocin/lantibiotic exporter with double-glycine peptidase domain
MLGGVTALLAAAVGAALLSVPYVPQREDTCGPAALAMVLRYWGRPVLHDELAATLVDPELHGTPGARLAELARAEGLRAVAFSGDLAALREAIARGRPPLVAWAMGGGRYHNVVVVGFAGDSPVVHDPARGAARRVPRDRFESRWAGAGHWTLLVAPEAPAPAPESPPP